VEATITELDLAKLLPPLETPAPSATQGWHPALESVVWAAPAPAMLPMKLTGHLTVGHIKHEFYDAQSLDVKWNLTDVTPISHGSVDPPT